MIYFVTYASTRSKKGPNPFGHSCVWLSVLDESVNKIRVVDVWGFYGIPSTPGVANSLLKSMKTQIGLNIDFTGNHGYLRHEEPRYLEMNSEYFLYGSTFELTADQFNSLKNLFISAFEAQLAAVDEAVNALNLQSRRQKKFSIYPYELDSRQIFAWERKKNGINSRLKPFEVRLSYDLSDPLRQSRTCKSQILSWLSTELSPEHIALLTENGKHPSIPIRSGIGESLYLHCKGPLKEHVNKKGAKAYYHEPFGYGTNDQVDCYFTIPPQIVYGSTDTCNRVKLDPRYCDSIKGVVAILQRLRWVLINAGLSEQDSVMLKQVVAGYEAFSTIAPEGEVCTSPTSSNNNLFFTVTLSEAEDPLLTKLKKAQQLLNSIYTYIEDSQDELIIPLEEGLLNRSSGDERTEIASLPNKVKQKICALLDKPLPNTSWYGCCLPMGFRSQ